jgi:hypothetical protein
MIMFSDGQRVSVLQDLGKLTVVYAASKIP